MLLEKLYDSFGVWVMSKSLYFYVTKKGVSERFETYEEAKEYIRKSNKKDLHITPRIEME